MIKACNIMFLCVMVEIHWKPLRTHNCFFFFLGRYRDDIQRFIELRLPDDG